MITSDERRAWGGGNVVWEIRSCFNDRRGDLECSKCDSCRISR